MTPTSTVIVVSHRPGAWLNACLRSVREQADQIIVVDNASEGRVASEAGRAVGADVITARRNAGFAGGVQRGLAKARGDIVGVLNDDAVAGENWLMSAADHLRHPPIAAVTPKVVLAGRYAEIQLADQVWRAGDDARPLGRQLCSVTVDGVDRLGGLVGAGVYPMERDPSVEPAAWRWTTGRDPFYVPLPAGGEDAVIRVNGEAMKPTAQTTIVNHTGSSLVDRGAALEIGLGAPDDGRFDEPLEPFGFSGTAPVFRRETLAGIGGFARPFFAYNEDTDWCLRARLRGMRIAYDPKATVEHRLSATSGGPEAPRVRFLSRRNALLCLVRNAPPEIAARYLWRQMADGPSDGVRRSTLRLLPWAVKTRRSMASGWQQTPREVWDRWVGVGSTWEKGPVGRSALPDSSGPAEH